MDDALTSVGNSANRNQYPSSAAPPNRLLSKIASHVRFATTFGGTPRKSHIECSGRHETHSRTTLSIASCPEPEFPCPCGCAVSRDTSAPYVGGSCGEEPVADTVDSPLTCQS